MTPAALGHLAMFAFAGLVAGSFALGALAANELAPAALNAVRFAIAAALIGALAALRGIPRAALAAPWRYLVLGGLFASYFVAMFEGLKTAPAISAAAVFTLTPVMAGGFGWLLLRQRMTPRIALGLAIGAAGALWVIFRGEAGRLIAFEVGRGEAIYFAGCAAYALYTPMLARLNRGESPVVFTFFTMVAGCLVLLVWGGPTMLSTDWAALPAIVWVTIGYVAVFASAVSFLLLQFAALRLPSSKVMAYTYLTPSWVMLWQVLMGQETPPPVVLAGLGLTMLALWILLDRGREDVSGVRPDREPPQSGSG